MTLVGYTLLPLPTSLDIRGWHEMHPLNGPAWSLLFEYIANILHALVLRKLSKRALSLLVALAAIALIHLAITSPNGDIIGGWALDPVQLRIGFTRLLFPYMAGMLLRRAFTVKSGKNTFLISSLLLVIILCFPRLGGYDHLWINGIFDASAVIFVFPLIIYLGATGVIKSSINRRICTFLGDISYPIYILHFPFTYVFYAWVTENNIPMMQGFLVGTLLLAGTLLLSYAALKYYDEPIRRWLANRFMKNKEVNQ